MNGMIAIGKSSAAVRKRDVVKDRTVLDILSKNASLLLIALMFIAGSSIALSFGIPVKSVMGSYSYDVLVILIVMELFTNLIAETGIMQLLAIKISCQSSSSF